MIPYENYVSFQRNPAYLTNRDTHTMIHTPNRINYIKVRFYKQTIHMKYRYNRSLRSQAKLSI